MATDLGESDLLARERALDPASSFVVQAPAGSGKTSLLTDRLLALLAVVDAPEEIIAITFTRKAAAEMRNRVIKSLRAAHSADEPAKAHEATTWRLARAALARSDAKGWSLDLQPTRLRIQTIDALAKSLAGALPILSRAGATLEVEPGAEGLYDDATLRLLGEIEEGGPVERDLAVLLAHFDNDYETLRNLFAEMLARRDQWLTAIHREESDDDWRERLEADLRLIANEALRQLSAVMPIELMSAIWESCRGAAGRWPEPDNAMRALADLRALPAVSAGNLPHWQAVARQLLLSERRAFRKAVTRTVGFPTTHRAEKQRHVELLAQLAAMPGALEAWADVAWLPGVHYGEAEWRVVAALLRLLKRLMAQLRVLFTERAKVDYTEVALAAREALGPPEEPTDLALRLDYRIRHILVDEFQDTSLAQVELLRRLTAGWTGTDGRTLFCVGDPMQSIYRFRQADVALFLKVRRHGIDNLRPQSLTLARNFRSQASIVDWVNAGFSRILPPADDFSRGAVRYEPVQSTRPAAHAPAVRLWPSLEIDEKREAARVLEIIREARARVPTASIAVLARTRSHLQEIARSLRAHALSFQAIDFEILGERRAVRDLGALTRALCHRDDRIAWLAVLRAPFCGLRLTDLTTLVEATGDRTLWESLNDAPSRALLSAEAQTILARVVPVLDASLTAFARLPLATVVEGAWLELGGPAALEEVSDLENARVFFERLAREERAGDLADPPLFDEALADLHAAPDAAATDRLQLMTIHKAKGLEWDVVIVPGLGRKPRGDGKRLLHTLELEHRDGSSSLILAPARAAAAEEEPLEAFVKRLDRERAEFENARLLYVAATRAKEELHLLGHATPRESNGGEPQLKPAAGSLLKALWPAVSEDFPAAAAAIEALAVAVEEPIELRSLLRRLPPDWRLPPLDIRPTAVECELGESETRPDFDWVTEVARQAGVVVHRDLERRVRTRLHGGDAPAPDARLYAVELRELGVPAERIEAASERVRRSIEQTLADARGQWILAAHAGESSEWAITAEVDGELRRLVVDRSFIDESGARWIIDYKTSAHEGGDVEAFLDREVERYAHQLARYAAVAARFGPQPLRIGLFFPLLAAWRELDIAAVGG